MKVCQFKRPFFHNSTPRLLFRDFIDFVIGALLMPFAIRCFSKELPMDRACSIVRRAVKALRRDCCFDTVYIRVSLIC